MGLPRPLAMPRIDPQEGTEFSPAPSPRRQPITTITPLEAPHGRAGPSRGTVASSTETRRDDHPSPYDNDEEMQVEEGDAAGGGAGRGEGRDPKSHGGQGNRDK